MAGNMEILSRLRDCIVNLDIACTEQACKEALAAGLPAYKALVEGLSKGMTIVGQKYEAREYFLSDLMLAGEAMKEATKILQPHFKTEDRGSTGKIVIGTVKGDLHDIGKNVVAMLLEATGFDVVDLGVDVSTQTFVQTALKQEADIVGMSALLTTTMPEMENVIKEIQRCDLMGKVKVIVGGAPISSEYGRSIGADAAARDAIDGVNLCKTWISHRRSS